MNFAFPGIEKIALTELKESRVIIPQLKDRIKILEEDVKYYKDLDDDANGRGRSPAKTETDDDGEESDPAKEFELLMNSSLNSNSIHTEDSVLTDTGLNAAPADIKDNGPPDDNPKDSEGDKGEGGGEDEGDS